MSDYTYIPPTTQYSETLLPQYNNNNNNAFSSSNSQYPNPAYSQQQAQPSVNTNLPMSPSFTNAVPGSPNSERETNRAHEMAMKILLDQIKTDQSAPAQRGRLIMALRAALGEFFATFGLMYAAYGSAIASRVMESGVGTAASMIVVSFVAMAMIYSFSAVSGAHMNPAVTFALFIRGKTSRRKFLFYVTAQLLGGVAAYLCLYLSYGADSNISHFVAIYAPGSAGTIFMNEFVLTFLLVLVIFKVAFEDAEDQKQKTMTVQGVATTRGLTVYTANTQSKLGFAPICIGFCIGSLGFLGPSSGGCYNPVRWIIPGIAASHAPYWYLYILGELCGAGLAAVSSIVFDKLAHLAAKAQAQSPIMAQHMEMIDRQE
jgi:aquaporin TIP